MTPKTPMELKYTKNWRPITLLNVDYKNVTHIIKNKILKALPSIISEVQSGLQAGKSTSDNLILMCLNLEYFQNNPDQETLLIILKGTEQLQISVKARQQRESGPFMRMM